MPNLATLRLDNNYALDDDGALISYGIRGSIPESIGNLKQLVELRLDNNYLGGTLPASLGNLQKLIIAFGYYFYFFTIKVLNLNTLYFF